MKICDTHCDTLCRIADSGGNLFENKYHVSIKSLNKYEAFTQFFACFIDPLYNENALERFTKLSDAFFENMKMYSDTASHCENYDDMVKAWNRGKTACFLSVENSSFIKKPDDVLMCRRKGIRLMSLVWNKDNHLASGAETQNDIGLTEIGKAVIRKMEDCGVFLDVSHMSDKSFYDACSVYGKPLVASHSNSRKVCDVKRNLTDEQFLAIIKSGGYVGVNLYPLFLTGSEKASVSDIIRHVEYFLSLGGEDTIGIGLDFDGVDFLPEGINGVCEVDKIFNEMAKIGYRSALIDKIAHKNLERLLKFF